MKLEHVLMGAGALILFLRSKNRQVNTVSPAAPEMPSTALLPEPLPDLPPLPPMPALPILPEPAVSRQYTDNTPVAYVSEQPAPTTQIVEPPPAPAVVQLAPIPGAKVGFSFSTPRRGDYQLAMDSGGSSRGRPRVSRL